MSEAGTRVRGLIPSRATILTSTDQASVAHSTEHHFEALGSGHSRNSPIQHSLIFKNPRKNALANLNLQFKDSILNGCPDHP